MRDRFELIGLRTVPKAESSSHVPASPNPSRIRILYILGGFNSHLDNLGGCHQAARGFSRKLASLDNLGGERRDNIRPYAHCHARHTWA